MKKFGKYVVILPLVLVTAALLTVPKSQLQTKLEPTKSPKKVDLNRLPIVEFSSSETNDAKRKARGEKHSKSRMMVDPEAISDSTVIVDSVDMNLPALPTEQAAAVVIGTVTRAQAHLSNDKTGVYSVFAVSVDEVLKKSKTLSVGNVIEAEREGGRVRFPSGRIHIYKVSEYDMPRVGGRYVLFLAATDIESVFEIITGYEIHDSIVYALDQLPQSLTYENRPAAHLLDQLRLKLVKP